MEVLALLLIVIAVVMLEGKLYSEFALKRLDYSCKFSVCEAMEGDEIFLVETLYNRKLLPLPWLKAEIISSKWLGFAETTSMVTYESRFVTSNFAMRGWQKTTRKWKLKCLKRGSFATNNISLAVGDLFGQSISSTSICVSANLIVYPQVVELEEIFIPANILHGNTLVKRWINEDPFIVCGAREYEPGDALNRIDWNATARVGEFMVKKNDYTSNLSYTILLNVQSVESEGMDTINKQFVELGIKVAATILDNAAKNGVPVSFGTNGSTTGGNGATIFTHDGSGPEHVKEILKILASLKLKSVREYEFFLEDNIEHLSCANRDIVFVTCYFNEAIIDFARRLKWLGNRVTFFILSFVEEQFIPEDLDVYMLPEMEDIDKI